MTGQHQSNLVKMIRDAAYRHSAWRVFTDFLALSAIAVSNAVDLRYREEREKKYLEIISAYDREEVNTISKMLAELVLALEAEMTDVLGQVFMELELGSKWSGQFFTPMHLCRMMARIALEDVDEKIKEKGYITIQEPTAGGGAMIIALAEEMKRLGYNYQKQMLVVATDIDIKAVHMCYLQLSLLGIPAVVYHGDSLSLKMFSEWCTPAYILDGWFWRLKTQNEKPLAIKTPAKKDIPRAIEQGKLNLEAI